MATYSRILLALDFHGDSGQVIAKGAELAKSNDAELMLLHVNEPLAIAYGVDGMSWGDQIVSLESSIRREAEAKLSAVANELKVPSENCFVREGKPANEIHELASQKEVDLIVMGTHGQSGLQLLLGSTANGVLHGSTCDVLAIRIGS